MAFAIGGGGGAPIHESLTALVAQASSLSIAVSYIQLSGWELLKAAIPQATLAGVRILCTDQLGITDPAAVRSIINAGVAIRVFNGTGVVFHPKVYIAHFANGPNRFVLGSANLSRPALLSSVEADFIGQDDDGTLSEWFDGLFNDPALSSDFDEARLSAMEAAFAARLKSRLLYQRLAAAAQANQVPPDTAAEVTMETAFAPLEGELMPLNIDKGGSTVRTLQYVHELLNGPVPLNDDKAAGDMRRLGFTVGLELTPLGHAAVGQDWEHIALLWAEWLKHAPEADLLAINPTGRLVRGRRTFDTFWTFPAEVTEYFLESAEGAPHGSGRRQLCQTIELLANAGRALPSLTLDDVATLSSILEATGALPQAAQEAVKDYLANRGTRGWKFPDRRLILEGWRNVQ